MRFQTIRADSDIVFARVEKQFVANMQNHLTDDAACATSNAKPEVPDNKNEIVPELYAMNAPAPRPNF